jgi:4-amino-4-deoxy-L-arabinose transferase-like glycosyltransferase
LMKILPFHYAVQLGKSFWADDDGKFAIYEPDFLIALFNQLLLFAAIAQTFFIARKLFDSSVAWLSAILIFGCDLLWQFSTSGISTILLLNIFLAIVWCVLKTEELSREPQPNQKRLLQLAVAAGFLAGLGALTRYAFGWAIVPVAAFLILFGGKRRVMHAVAAIVTFAVLLTPWIIRNYAVSGTPFGTASFAVVEGTFLFPRFQLERSLHPDLSQAFWLEPYLQKLADGVRDILENGLLKLGGGWASTFFLAGLLLQFRSIAVRRMRYFLLMCLGVFIIVQSLGRTYLSAKWPDINSENLLVLLAPLVFIYGVSLFFTLLDQMELPVFQLRYAVTAIFVIVCCLPMIFALSPIRNSPVAYPPYYPPEIQQTAGWLAKNDLEMSDIPWAVAWYGDRQCVWLTLNAQNEFYAVNDDIKPVRALYLTPETMDGKFLSDWILPGEISWGSFVIEAVMQKQTPPDFPLKYAPPFKMLPERLFLADTEFWKLRSDLSPSP